jgi:hypothetical protein
MIAAVVESSESSGGAAHIDPTQGNVNNMVRKTGTATEDLRGLKRLKNVRKQTSIRYNTILSCLSRLEFLHFEARGLSPIGKAPRQAIFFPFINIPG